MKQQQDTQQKKKIIITLWVFVLLFYVALFHLNMFSFDRVILINVCHGFLFVGWVCGRCDYGVGREGTRFNNFYQS